MYSERYLGTIVCSLLCCTAVRRVSNWSTDCYLFFVDEFLSILSFSCIAEVEKKCDDDDDDITDNVDDDDDDK